MSEITFLASSKPFQIPADIEEYNNRTVFKREEDLLNEYFGNKSHFMHRIK